jgi:hypothetical protein
MARLSFFDQLRYQAAKSVGDIDAFNKVIFKDELPHELVRPEFTAIFSGPPIASYALSSENTHLITPLGLVQDIQDNSQRPNMPVAEMGNLTYRYVPGRFQHSASLSRVKSQAGNLLGMLYRWMLISSPSLRVDPTQYQPVDDYTGDGVSLQVVDLDSDLLRTPFGLYVVELTENGDPISAEFWEKCQVSGASRQRSNGQVIVMDMLQIVMTRKVSAKNLISTGTFSAASVAGPIGTNGIQTDLTNYA